MTCIVKIEKLDSGFVVTGGSPEFRNAYTALEPALQQVLFQLTGKGPHFSGSSYANLIIEYAQP